MVTLSNGSGQAEKHHREHDQGDLDDAHDEVDFDQLGLERAEREARRARLGTDGEVAQHGEQRGDAKTQLTIGPER